VSEIDRILQAGFVFAEDLVDLLVEASDPLIEIPKEADEQVTVTQGASPTLKLRDKRTGSQR